MSLSEAMVFVNRVIQSSYTSDDVIGTIRLLKNLTKKERLIVHKAVTAKVDVLRRKYIVSPNMEESDSSFFQRKDDRVRIANLISILLEIQRLDKVTS